MKKFLLGAVAASVLAFSGNAMANFVAGQDYQVVAKPVKVEKPAELRYVNSSGTAVVTVSRLNHICRAG